MLSSLKASADNTVIGRNNWIYLLFLICFYVTLNLPFLLNYPPVDFQGDESWMMNMSLEILRSGEPVASIHKGTVIAESPQITALWLYNGLLAGVFTVFEPSVRSGRMLSFVLGILVTVLTYGLGKRLVNEKVGFAASLMMCASIVFSWHSREMRPEMALLFLVTLSVYLFYRALSEKNDMLLFLSGLVSTISVQAHQHGAIISISMCIMYLFARRRMLFSRSTVFFVSGLSIGFFCWLFFNYLPYSTSSFQDVHAIYVAPLISEGFLSATMKAFVDIYESFSCTYLNFLKTRYGSGLPVGLAYVGLSSILAAIIFGKNRKPLTFCLLFMVLSLFVKNYVTGAWSFFHNSLFLPFIFIALAISLHDICDLLPVGRHKKLLFAILVILVISAGVADIMKKNIDMKEYDISNLTREISTRIPPGARVMGSGIYYFAFSDDPDRFSTYLFMQGRCPDFGTVVEEQKIDYIIVDDLLVFFSNGWCTENYFKFGINSFLNTRARLVARASFEYPTAYAPDNMLRNAYIYKVK